MIVDVVEDDVELVVDDVDEVVELVVDVVELLVVGPRERTLIGKRSPRGFGSGNLRLKPMNTPTWSVTRKHTNVRI